ncbi:4040_t:CDS:1, partial [Gigaspora rosea]
NHKMSKRRRQFDTKLLSLGIINPQLHYSIWSKAWWEKVDIKTETGTNHFVISYRLYMCIE